MNLIATLSSGAVTLIPPPGIPLSSVTTHATAIRPHPVPLFHFGFIPMGRRAAGLQGPADFLLPLPVATSTATLTCQVIGNCIVTFEITLTPGANRGFFLFSAIFVDMPKCWFRQQVTETPVRPRSALPKRRADRAIKAL